MADWSFARSVGLPAHTHTHTHTQVSIPPNSFQENPTHSDFKGKGKGHPATDHEGPEEE